MAAEVSTFGPSRSRLLSKASLEEEEEPPSRQLEILMERRRQEEVRKARYHWSLLRNSIRNTIQAIKQADVKSVITSHGIHHLRNLNHESDLKQVIFIDKFKEYMTTDGKNIRIFLEDGRKKKTYVTEEEMDHITYCPPIKEYVGRMTGGDELYLMNSSFDIVSQARAPSKIVLSAYNSSINEFITVGPGYIVSWAFRYGARHLIPRKMTKTDFKEKNMFSQLALESTPSRSQRIYLAVGNGAACYNVFDGTLLSYRKDLHERLITTMAYFNPLKYLATGALDGTIKVWDHKWHVMMVFVGHTGQISALNIYPHGSAIISASTDRTIRVWNLDTCDEVDRAVLEEPVDGLQTTLDYDMFFTYTKRKVTIWKIQHLYQLHTSVGQRVVKIKHTTHPNFSLRTVMVSRDASVRLVSPINGEVITTLLLNPARGLVDIAYAVEEELMFTVLNNGDILKVRTDTNPCRVIDEWKCPDPEKEACNYLLVYEYVVDIELETDTWSAIKRGVATKSLQAVTMSDDEEEEPDNNRKKAKRSTNRTLLLGGRKDGYICVYNWETGKVDFKIDAHGSKGVMSMIANAKVDQLISAGKDNFIKVWRVYPFVEEALAPIMSFFCAHLPLHMTMIKTNLCVAFQDHGTATYSVVMYNLRDRNRFDHQPGDDHSDAITGVTACPRLKLYASASLDGTIRIWNETNKLVRLLQLKSVPYSVGFCSSRADLLVGMGNHMYKIPHYAFLPKAFMFRMVSMKFLKEKTEKAIPVDMTLAQKLSKRDLARLKNSHMSFKFDNYTDILSTEEMDEINREKVLREKEFATLEKRDSELKMIRDGDLISGKKPKSTNYTKNAAFRNYMKMYYDKPRPTIPVDDPYAADRLIELLKTPEPRESPKYKPEKEPTGFFPPASEAVKPKTSPKPAGAGDGTPLQAPYPITPSGFIPNSVLVKLLWPPETKSRLREEAKEKEWTLPSFSLEQLDQIAKSKSKVAEGEEDEEGVKRQVTFAEDETEEEHYIDWGDEEEVPVPVADSQERDDSDLSKGSSKNKFADIMSASPPKQDLDQETDEELDGPQKSDLSEKRPPSDTQQSDMEPKPPTAPKEATKRKKSVKLPPKPMPEPQALPSEALPNGQEEKQAVPVSVKKQPARRPSPRGSPRGARARAKVIPIPTAEQSLPLPSTPTPRKTAARQPAESRMSTKTPSPPPTAHTPVPSFINQFKGVEWFDTFFPTLDETTLPKPWTMDNFVTNLIRLIKAAEYHHKVPIMEGILMMHIQEVLSDSVKHAVCKAILSVLNNEKDPPTCLLEEQRNFIVSALKVLHKMSLSEKEMYSELLVQFLDGDKEVRATVQSILASSGLQDPHRYLPKELDSWDIWNVEEEDRKADLRKMCQQWLDRWMTSYKLHLEDAIERLQKGQNIHGRMTKDQMSRKRTNTTSTSKGAGILRRSVGVGTDSVFEDQETVTTLENVDARMTKAKAITVTFDRAPDPALLENAGYMDAMNYFCDMMMEKELEAMKAPGKRLPGSKENVVQAKNTVLVLPKLPHKPCLVRLGETHTSTCRAHRETNLHVDYRLPAKTDRGNQPIPGQINGFVNSINLPMKSVNLNPFHSTIDEFDLRFQEPILITLKSSQKYFVPSQSVVHQDAVAAAL